MFIKNYRSDSYSKTFVWIILYSTLDFEVKANYSLQCEYSEQLAIILVSHREIFRSLHALPTSNFRLGSYRDWQMVIVLDVMLYFNTLSMCNEQICLS